MNAVLVQYVIYDHPRDLPTPWAVRRWEIRAKEVVPDPEPYALADSLEEARAKLPKCGLINIGRLPGDDPVIAEVWT